MPCIIEALETVSLSEDPIHFSKLDIKDGLWRMVCLVGEKSSRLTIVEWSVLPTRLVLPDNLA